MGVLWLCMLQVMCPFVSTHVVDVLYSWVLRVFFCIASCVLYSTRSIVKSACCFFLH